AGWSIRRWPSSSHVRGRCTRRPPIGRSLRASKEQDVAGSKRFEIDLGVNASGAVKGARDAAMAFENLEDAVGDAADESKRSGRDLDSFARKVVDAARKAGKSDDEIKDALRTYGVSAKDAERAIGRV